jgi:hypothetical protein
MQEDEKLTMLDVSLLRIRYTWYKTNRKGFSSLETNLQMIVLVMFLQIVGLCSSIAEDKQTLSFYKYPNTILDFLKHFNKFPVLLS